MKRLFLFIVAVTFMLFSCKSRSYSSNSDIQSIKDKNYVFGLYQEKNSALSEEYSFRLCHLGADGKIKEADVAECTNPFVDKKTKKRLTFAAVPAESINIKTIADLGVHHFIRVTVVGAVIALVPITLIAGGLVSPVLGAVKQGISSGAKAALHGLWQGLKSGAVLTAVGSGGLLFTAAGAVLGLGYISVPSLGVAANLDEILATDNLQSPIAIQHITDKTRQKTTNDKTKNEKDTDDIKIDVMSVVDGLSEILKCDVVI